MQQQSDLETGDSKVVVQLSLVGGYKGCCSLQFDDNAILNEEIQPERTNRHILVAHLEWRLLACGEPAQMHLVYECLAVNGFEPTVAEVVVALVERADDPTRDVPIYQVLVIRLFPVHPVRSGSLPFATPSERADAEPFRSS
jgi:hypothetical protein